MQNNDRIAVWLLALMALSLGAAACSSDSSTGSLLPQPDSILKRPDWTTFSGAKGEFSLRPVSSEDLVSADGQCVGTGLAAGSADATAGGGGQQSAALVPGSVALQMTECDVVRRAGPPENVALGADERGDRTVVLTYTHGPLPGIYRFIGGRLAVIERAPGAPPAAATKPQKPKTAKKPAA
jgi:hypothetical protein